MGTNVDENEAKGLNDIVKLRDHTFCEENLHLYTPTPFYQEYSTTGVYDEDVEEEKDMKYVRDMYPESATQIMEHIEDECDKLEYEGSMMFDEYPDKWMVMEIEMRIYEKVKHMEADLPEKDLAATGYDRRPGWGPGPGPGWGPGPGSGLLGDLVHVLLYDEMYKRRCRYRRCRRRYY